MITPIEVTPSSIPGPVKVARIPATARKQLVFKLTDAYGQPVDLKAEVPNPPAGVPAFGVEPPAQGTNVSLRLRAMRDDMSNTVQFDVVGEIISTNTGFVQFLLDSSVTDRPGVYPAEIGRFAGDVNLVDTWQVLIVIEPSVFQTLQGSGPLTTAEIRLALLDVADGTEGAPFNGLLDGVEFSDMEIAMAIRRAVDMWNETPPPVVYYTTNDFPYRYHWIMATSAILLRGAAARYRRNNLQYSGGGVSVNDQNKSQEYEQIASDRMAEFKEWMKIEKYRINMGFCWAMNVG